MRYQMIHHEVMGLDPRIRLVTICDMEGKIMFSDHRPGVVNVLTSDESKESLEMAINAWKKRTKLAPKIGKGRYVLAEYEKLKRITMPFGDSHLLYITTEVDADHARVINGVQQIAAKES